MGSVSAKIYRYQKKDLFLEKSVSFHFGKILNSNNKAIEKISETLVCFFNRIKQEYKDWQIKLFTTGIFRKLSDFDQRYLTLHVFEKTKLFLNIISHDLENFYLENSLINKVPSGKKVILLNIGGKTTEMVFLKGKKVSKRVNLDFGIIDVLKKFPNLNDEFSREDQKNVVAYIKKKLPVIDIKDLYPIVFYNGGELTFMRLTGYRLKRNHIIKDNDHPLFISLKDFIKGNRSLLYEKPLSKLKSLYSQDPDWMLGARPCSLIAQAIFEKLRIKFIIPSDSNLIDGVINKEFRRVTISGSFRKHLKEILALKNYFERLGIEVLSPRFRDISSTIDGFVIFKEEENYSPFELEDYHLRSIMASDALIVCDPGGYVGVSATLEIGFAYGLKKRIIFLEEPKEFVLKLIPAEYGL